MGLHFHFDGQSLSFTVLAVNGAWKGTVGKQGAVLTGTWNGGHPSSNFSRDTFLPAAKPLCRGQDMAGDAGGWPAIVANPADGKTLTGTWTQGQPLPLNFERQAAAEFTSAYSACHLRCRHGSSAGGRVAGCLEQGPGAGAHQRGTRHHHRPRRSLTRDCHWM